MRAIDTRNKLNNYVKDKDISIPKKKLYDICKLYKSGETCRYIMLTTDGYICIKHLPIADVIDKMVKNNQIIATGNNCEGIKIHNETKKESKEKEEKTDPKDY